jgi:hypothetical protein
MKHNALELLLKQKRFDLIFKYLYLKNRDKNPQFFEDLYIEHIRAFNGFSEEHPSDGVPKETKEAFVNSFNTLFDSIKTDGFNESLGAIPIGANGDIADGAHRLATCAFLGLDVETTNVEDDYTYDYNTFINKGINQDMADYAALEYVNLNPNTYIINLHSVVDIKNDEKVEKILNKYGFIFYKKDVVLNYNAYVNLKKINYGSFWERDPWIGDLDNQFKGAQGHAKDSMGDNPNPLRAYVFVCDNFDDILKVKAEIRDLLKVGNTCVHINDTRDEAMWLAKTYFNNNSLDMLTKRPFLHENKEFEELLTIFNKSIIEQNLDQDDFCCAGSTPLEVYGVRKSSDLDYLSCNKENFTSPNKDISNHDNQLEFYPYSKEEIIYNPLNHFYFNGMKFISLDILHKMKKKRNEDPKDIDDCVALELLQKEGIVRFKRKRTFKLFKIKKKKNKRKLIILGFIKITLKVKKDKK